MGDTAQHAGAPFRVSVSDTEVVAHPGWQSARSRVFALLRTGTRRIAVLGPPGVGKSLLLRHLSATVPPTTALFLDDADQLDGYALAALPPATACVLAGLPEFADRLAQLSPPATLVWLDPLSPEEVARFVATRLGAAGQPRGLLSPDAILALARQSGGIPRLINVLAGAAMFAASFESATHVTAEHINGAASFRDGALAPPPVAETPAEAPQPIPKPRAVAPLVARSAPAHRRPVVAWGIAALVLVAGAWAILPRSHPTQPPDLPTPPLASAPAPAPAPQPTPAPASVPNAATPPRPPAPPAPEREGPRIVIQVRPEETAQADAITALLEPSYGPIETRLVDTAPDRLTIRYFYAADSAAAHELAATLARAHHPWRIRNLSSGHPLPPPGTLEIWLP